MNTIDSRTRFALEAWRIVDAAPDWDDVIGRVRGRGERRRGRSMLMLIAAAVALAAAVSPALGLVGYVETALRGSPDRGFPLVARLAGDGVIADFSASMPHVLVARRGRKGTGAPIIFTRLRSHRRPDLRLSLRWRLRVFEGRIDRLSLRPAVGQRTWVELCQPCPVDPAGTARARGTAAMLHVRRDAPVEMSPAADR